MTVDVPAACGVRGSRAVHAAGGSTGPSCARCGPAGVPRAWPPAGVSPATGRCPRSTRCARRVIAEGRSRRTRAGRARPGAGRRRRRSRRDAGRPRGAARRARRPRRADGFVAPDVDATPSRLLRVTALAWADVATDQLVQHRGHRPADRPAHGRLPAHPAGRGLPAAAARERPAAEAPRAAGRLDGPQRGDRLAAADGMILAADALRAVFDGGESGRLLGPSVARRADAEGRRGCFDPRRRAAPGAQRTAFGRPAAARTPAAPDVRLVRLPRPTTGLRPAGPRRPSVRRTRLGTTLRPGTARP